MLKASHTKPLCKDAKPTEQATLNTHFQKLYRFIDSLERAVCKKQTAHFSYIKRLFNVIRLNYRFGCQCTNYMISIDLKTKKGYT